MGITLRPIRPCTPLPLRWPRDWHISNKLPKKLEKDSVGRKAKPNSFSHNLGKEKSPRRERSSAHEWEAFELSVGTGSFLPTVEALVSEVRQQVDMTEKCRGRAEKHSEAQEPVSTAHFCVGWCWLVSVSLQSWLLLEWNVQCRQEECHRFVLNKRLFRLKNKKKNTKPTPTAKENVFGKIAFGVWRRVAVENIW